MLSSLRVFLASTPFQPRSLSLSINQASSSFKYINYLLSQQLPSKMGFLEKSTGPNYSPIRDDQSATSSDDLIYDGHGSGRSRSKTSRRKSYFIALGGFIIFLVYSAVLVTFTSMWWKKERIHGANVIDCKF
jgi:hypothetical protein